MCFKSHFTSDPRKLITSSQSPCLTRPRHSGWEYNPQFCGVPLTEAG